MTEQTETTAGVSSNGHQEHDPILHEEVPFMLKDPTRYWILAALALVAWVVYYLADVSAAKIEPEVDESS